MFGFNDIFTDVSVCGNESKMQKAINEWVRRLKLGFVREVCTKIIVLKYRICDLE